MKIIVVDVIPDFKNIYESLSNKIDKDYKISDKGENPDLYINIDRNYKTDLSRVVFSSGNREYERYFKDKFPGGETIINYSYLSVKNYPTVGIELDYEYAKTEKGIDQVSDLIIKAIYEHDKT
jgi:hypothetical protein